MREMSYLSKLADVVEAYLLGWTLAALLFGALVGVAFAGVGR